ncbi:tRNA preQ1(34) S-adenosylmethionine ribosyltransferase-isomerase QueA [Persicirhabdus sediminis]|uniref:S-adenosylmethionine:tRNA ribosyltransferase-isomerase n=1 Tax=Persicirhabdus sediminis TaxID=454144 RepID=A0A8J7MGS0_9BACT|nr:tRNA preQ1(34) S-adenosylmethionine ribosyltransferase-isomerase QueA [Persicirhabdus sediminis]MBK1792518.1 tRNA preQ1(34) S-adenosylmethionine ribosyltransferase-isomerase QueA [Persicirhabdus sediminis]
MDLRTADFDYHLPEELIASRPLENRAASRMMVIDRKTGTIEHKMFADFPQYMREDDMIVLNDTKVIPARFHSNDGKIEMVLTDKLSATEWSCLVRPGKKMKVGRTVEVADATGTVVAIQENGNRIISWDKELDIDEVGHLALPHYMNREDDKADRDRYQTVYAREEGAIAAPTAGLHFTPEMLAKLPHTFLTLHVGVGTFRPVKAEYIKDHDMHSERYHLSAQSAEKINQAGRVISTGTTCTRVLESLGKVNPTLSEATGETDIFISPPYDFQVVDCLLTNFHLPQSTLIMLVSAFADRDLILKAYNEAVAHKYRFFSYGDCMLIL